ncbi:hypothetical protein [Micromonospora zhanjiangensis]|uniref:Uncharacterized protein n=1 Tax=Micromonospora zhanjiangensis TaxID=1522057 RepID=A0ABV8KLA2_9ACTN
MNNSDMLRYRRQMHRRIRDVVAERRLARQVGHAEDDTEAGPAPVEQTGTDHSLIA